jgi:hypothetical protein
MLNHCNPRAADPGSRGLRRFTGTNRVLAAFIATILAAMGRLPPAQVPRVMPTSSAIVPLFEDLGPSSSISH